MIIRGCTNTMCLDPLYTGECKKECVKRYEREMGVKKADLVEVVRCKDCQYWDKAKVNKKGFLICPASGMEITADDFCSKRERKDT